MRFLILPLLLLGCQPDPPVQQPPEDTPTPMHIPVLHLTDSASPPALPAADITICSGRSGQAFLETALGAAEVTDTLLADTAHTLSAPGNLYLCGGTWPLALTIQTHAGIFGSDGATITGEGVRTPITITGDGHHLTLEDITVADGLATSASYSFGDAGGGIFCVGDSTISATGLILSRNSATRGGGLYLEGCTAAITALTATENTASFGAALHLIYGSLTLTDATISGSVSDFGALTLLDASATISHAYFAGNDADWYGGALDAGYTDLTLSDSIFIANHASLGGAASIKHVEGTITDTFFIDNTARSGGAMYIDDYDFSTLYLEDVEMTDNIADDTGGGIYSLSSDVVLHITNNGITDNSPDDIHFFFAGASYTLADGLDYLCEAEHCTEQ